MNIDERLRALTMNLELLSHEREKDGEQIQQLISLAAKDGEQIQQLIVLAQKDGQNIHSLAKIAEVHDRRLNHLEGNAQ